jgi:hypothetical protein
VVVVNRVNSAPDTGAVALMSDVFESPAHFRTGPVPTIIAAVASLEKSGGKPPCE